MKNSKIATLTEKTPDRFYDRLLNNLQEAVNILDTDLNIIFWNASSEKLTGYSSDEVLGKSCLKNGAQVPCSHAHHTHKKPGG
jgi:PAS domain S-box-containing protein